MIKKDKRNTNKRTMKRLKNSFFEPNNPKVGKKDDIVLGTLLVRSMNGFCSDNKSRLIKEVRYY